MKVYCNIFSYLFMGVAGICLWLVLFSKSCLPESAETVITDTIYVKVPYKEVEIKQVEVPKKVIIYKRDTLLRLKIIRDTIISGIEISRKAARIHTLSPQAQPIIKEFSIENFKELSINHKGQLEVKERKHPKRQKRLKRLARVGIFIGGFFVGREVYRK